MCESVLYYLKLLNFSAWVYIPLWRSVLDIFLRCTTRVCMSWYTHACTFLGVCKLRGRQACELSVKMQIRGGGEIAELFFSSRFPCLGRMQVLVVLCEQVSLDVWAERENRNRALLSTLCGWVCVNWEECQFGLGGVYESVREHASLA